MRAGLKLLSNIETLQGMHNRAVRAMQVYLSPLGAGEWAHLDFQAMMCGCLVLKPGAHLFRTYPNVFVADELVSSVHVEWGDLRGRLQSIFQVLSCLHVSAAALCTRPGVMLAHVSGLLCDRSCNLAL